MDRHLADARYCENVPGGKAFNGFTVDDAAKVRDDLKTARNHRGPQAHTTRFARLFQTAQGSPRFDIPNRRVLQDASVVRAKNSKALNIVWFPTPKLFENVVIDWVSALTPLGFRDSDVLFPSSDWLPHRKRLWICDRELVPVMSMKHAAISAFTLACRDHAKQYTPHAAKRTIGASPDIRHLTHEQRRAWSENKAHENEQITTSHFGKLSKDFWHGKSDWLRPNRREVCIRCKRKPSIPRGWKSTLRPPQTGLGAALPQNCFEPDVTMPPK
mgnify:CR=1 FL=1